MGSAAEGTGCCHIGVTLDSRVQATLITSVGTQGFCGKPGSREGGFVSESDYECGMTTGPGVGQEGWEVKEGSDSFKTQGNTNPLGSSVRSQHELPSH